MMTIFEGKPADTDNTPNAVAARGQCFLCGRMARREVWSEGRYRAVACDCGLAFVQPVPPEGEIDPMTDGHPASFYLLSRKEKVAWLARHVPSGRLLEIGCGEGYFLDQARRSGYDVTGMEPHPDRASAVARCGIPVLQFFLEDAPLPEKGFDVVYHCDLLSHFPDPVSAVRKMCGFLAPGGVLCFEVGVLAGFSPLWYKCFRKIGLPQHRWLYSSDALELLFERCGLVVEDSCRFGHAPAVAFGGLMHCVLSIARPLLRAAGLHQNRVIGTNLVAAEAPLERDWRTATADYYDYFRNFLRYGVGKITPPVIGPSTVMVIARPDGARSVVTRG